MSGGTPPTSPRFGAPRYSDTTDTASFSADVNAITDALDHAVKLTQTIKTANYTAVDGDAVIVGSGAAAAVTITLPSHAAGQIVAVSNFSTHGTTVAGDTIQGEGLSAASSFPLGAVGSRAILWDSGSGWYIMSGQQDSGWVALTLSGGGGVYQTATGFDTPSARLVGDRVELKGAIQALTNRTVGSAWATVPSTAYHPAVLRGVGVSLGQMITSVWHAPGSAAPNAGGIVDTTGVLYIAAAANTNDILLLDGCSYALS